MAGGHKVHQLGTRHAKPGTVARPLLTPPLLVASATTRICRCAQLQDCSFVSVTAETLTQRRVSKGTMKVAE
jgi:hypothetical protein